MTEKRILELFDELDADKGEAHNERCIAELDRLLPGMMESLASEADCLLRRLRLAWDVADYTPDGERHLEPIERAGEGLIRLGGHVYDFISHG